MATFVHIKGSEPGWFAAGNWGARKWRAAVDEKERRERERYAGE